MPYLTNTLDLEQFSSEQHKTKKAHNTLCINALFIKYKSLNVYIYIYFIGFQL